MLCNRKEHVWHIGFLRVFKFRVHLLVMVLKLFLFLVKKQIKVSPGLHVTAFLGKTLVAKDKLGKSHIFVHEQKND